MSLEHSVVAHSANDNPESSTSRVTDRRRSASLHEWNHPRGRRTSERSLVVRLVVWHSSSSQVWRHSGTFAGVLTAVLVPSRLRFTTSLCSWRALSRTCSAHRRQHNHLSHRPQRRPHLNRCSLARSQTVSSRRRPKRHLALQAPQTPSVRQRETRRGDQSSGISLRTACKRAGVSI